MSSAAVACTLALLVQPPEGGPPERMPVERNLIERIEYVDSVSTTTASKIIFKKITWNGGKRLEPMFAQQTPAQIKRMRCDPILGE